jgi:hypothetical protein
MIVERYHRLNTVPIHSRITYLYVSTDTGKSSELPEITDNNSSSTLHKNLSTDIVAPQWMVKQKKTRQVGQI